ncbi:MAG TPA: acyl transferase, partial [Mucilaginibacter sp.]|nr:acyl transferase [Mucilaginibacter sp.]
MNKPVKEQIFSITNDEQFVDAALQLFRFQAENCAVYKEFIANLGVDPTRVKSIDHIPFLPISFFKTLEVLSSTQPVEVTFTSSGTTGMTNSKHQVTDVSWYEESFRRAFEIFYGDIRDYCV